MDSVAKKEENSLATAIVPTHSYNTRSKDKLDVHNTDPGATIHLIQEYSKKEGQSESQFMSKQLEHHGNWEHKKLQEMAAKRQENQNKLPGGKDFDVHRVDVDEQTRLYEEAQRASKQASKGQNHQAKGNMDAHNGAIGGSQQYGGGHNHPPGIQQGSSVDSASYRQNVEQQEVHGPQVPQHYDQQSSYHQGSHQDLNVGHSGYGYNDRQHHFHNSQVPLQQNQQPGYHQGVPHHQSQSNSQLPYPQPDRAAQMAHIPRAGGTGDNFPRRDPAAQMAHIPRAGGVGDNFPHYNQPSDVPYNHNGSTGYGPHRQVQHQYEPVPGPINHHEPYSQQQLQQQQNADDSNPYKLEEGSMILYGDPPRSGMVKWIGYLPEAQILIAGVEMVSI